MKTKTLPKDAFHLVGRNRIAAESARYVLEHEGFVVSGVSLDAAETWDALQAGPMPAILIVGSELPDGSGLSLLRTVREQYPSVRRVLFLHDTEPDYVKTAYDEGLDGLLSPNSGLAGFLACACAVQKGSHYICERLSSMLRQRFGVDTATGHPILSPREQQVLEKVAEGLSSKQIAEKLCISLHTVDNHRRNIIQKLGLSGRNALERYVLRKK